MVSEHVIPASSRLGDPSSFLNCDHTQTLVSIQLKGGNYYQWANVIKRALNLNNLESHILDEPLEESNPSFREWKKKDDHVFIMLLNSVDEVHKAMVSCAPNSKSLWDQMFSLYGLESNLGRIFELKKQISSIKKEGKSLPQLFGEYTDAWNELSTLRPETADLKVIRKRREEDKVFGLLMALDESYSHLRQEILRMKDFPSFGEVQNMIQRAETSLRLEEHSKTDWMFKLFFAIPWRPMRLKLFKISGKMKYAPIARRRDT